MFQNNYLGEKRKIKSIEQNVDEIRRVKRKSNPIQTLILNNKRREKRKIKSIEQNVNETRRVNRKLTPIQTVKLELNFRVPAFRRGLGYNVPEDPVWACVCVRAKGDPEVQGSMGSNVER